MLLVRHLVLAASSFSSLSMYMCVFVVCVCVYLCVYLCDREREREKTGIFAE